MVGYSASNFGIGTYGQAVSASAEGASIAGQSPIGVWGDSGAPGGTGVLASADNGFAIVGINNSDGGDTAFFENDESSDTSDRRSLATYGGAFGGQCVIDVSGNLSCTGTKSAVVPVDGGTRKVALYAVESPENWFEDFGSGQLSNGAATISLKTDLSPNGQHRYGLSRLPDSEWRFPRTLCHAENRYVVRGPGARRRHFQHRL